MNYNYIMNLILISVLLHNQELRKAVILELR